jgi:hypothetical protein
MSTGLKWVDALRISCCSGLLRSICEVSTICGEIPPEGDSTQNGPPTGSPWLRTTPQTRMGRSRASIRNRFRSWGSAWANPSGKGRQSSLSRKSPASRSTASARFPARRPSVRSSSGRICCRPGLPGAGTGSGVAQVGQKRSPGAGLHGRNYTRAPSTTTSIPPASPCTWISARAWASYVTGSATSGAPGR